MAGSWIENSGREGKMQMNPAVRGSDSNVCLKGSDVPKPGTDQGTGMEPVTQQCSHAASLSACSFLKVTPKIVTFFIYTKSFRYTKDHAVGHLCCFVLRCSKEDRVYHLLWLQRATCN